MSFFKKLRPSRRGLTFSYRASDILPVGKHYSYIVDAKEGTIIIIPDENGPMTVSRKGAGKNKKPLIDIRRHDVRSMVSAADYLIVESVRDGIRVRIYSDSKDGFYINLVLEHLSGRYEISTQVVKDCDVGGYTTRKRLFCIGSRIGRISLPDIHILPMKTVGDAFKLLDHSWPNMSDISNNSDKVRECMSYVAPGHNWKDIPSSVQTFAANKHSSVYHRLDLHGQSPTIVNYRKTCLIHPTENRGLSVSEAAALMGLDKHFRFVGKLSDMQQQVANGVTMAMGTLVRKTVVKCLDAFHAGTVVSMA